MSVQRFPVRQWATSYYLPERKKWMTRHWAYGNLSVNAKGITFMAVPSGKYLSIKESICLDLPFKEVTEIKKSTSALIFSALVVVTKQGSHWFSSLTNRDATYNVIEHFWRTRLIPEKSRLSWEGCQPTKMGSELLKLAHDSEKTLQEAGTQLKSQGVQLDHAMGVMGDIDNDLEVAERVLSGLESWLGNWKMPPKMYTSGDIEIISSSNVPTVYDFPMVFSQQISDQRNSSKVQPLEKGILRLSKEGVSILNSGQLCVHHFSKRDISAVQVLTPWELVITRYLIGQPDISYDVVSTHMVQILKALEPVYRAKINYTEPPEDLREESSPSSRTSLTSESSKSTPVESIAIQPLCIGKALRVDQSTAPSMSHGLLDQPMGAKQVQKDSQSTKIVTETEAEELVTMVARMKDMALDIQSEQDSQMEKIDSLTSTVELTTDQLKVDTRRMKRLL